MRYFFSTGEPSGELVAVTLAKELLRIDSDPHFEGIGAQRMRVANFSVPIDHTGWASMGPLAAIPRIPKLLTTMWSLAKRLAKSPPDVLVLVDFGAFNMRLAAQLREKHHYTGPILYVFPPGAWLDRSRQAQRVAELTTACPGYEHQANFYAGLGLPVLYHGHPLSGSYELRADRLAPPPDAGIVALLPGSRRAEIRAHLSRLFGAVRCLREQRPNLHPVVGAANEMARRDIEVAISHSGLHDIQIVDGGRAALEMADAAWVASGTAVLEASLLGVPTVSLYVLSRLLVRHARRVYSGRYITLPNLILDREVVKELLQDDATPQALATAMDTVLRNPSKSRQDMQELHAKLGGQNSAAQIAMEAFQLAKGV